jgi:chaperonin GroES
MPNPKIRPVGDRILVQRAVEKEQIRGGIVIPDHAQEKPQEATVMALGAGRRASDGSVTPFEVKIGDIVLVGKFAGADVRLHDQNYTLVREDDILGVIA